VVAIFRLASHRSLSLSLWSETGFASVPKPGVKPMTDRMSTTTLTKFITKSVKLQVYNRVALLQRADHLNCRIKALQYRLL
jgi:hypothetical protein